MLDVMELSVETMIPPSKNINPYDGKSNNFRHCESGIITKLNMQIESDYIYVCIRPNTEGDTLVDKYIIHKCRILKCTFRWK